MLGPVSISGSCLQHAKEALVYFYKNYFGDQKPSLHTRTPYRLSQFSKDEMQQIFKGDDYTADFKVLRE